MQPDGSFALDLVFPHGGTFRLFSDFKATGKPGAVVAVDINVDGTPSPTVALAASNLSEARVLGDYRVRMTSPVPPAGTSATLKFLVVKNKLPVTDLQLYLGALWHLVIIHEDGKTFLHSHPEDHAAHRCSGASKSTRQASRPFLSSTPSSVSKTSAACRLHGPHQLANTSTKTSFF